MRSASKEHREAIISAFHSGINLVDTSSHFGSGSAESLVGECIKQCGVPRDQLVMVSKAGFVTDANVHPSWEAAVINQSMQHCISYGFLRSEIEASLKRMDLESLDVFLINNPERMLHATNKRITTTVLYEMLGETFHRLDQLVASGMIGSFGICSNSMHIRTSQEFLSLERILELASDNFSTIQVPFNLFEKDAIDEGFDGSPSLLNVCKTNGVFAMLHRPLNTIENGKIRLLAQYELSQTSDEAAIVSHLTKLFDDAASQESRLASCVDAEDTFILSMFVWSQVLAENLTRLTENVFAAQHYFDKQATPSLECDIQKLLELKQNDVQFVRWTKQYEVAIKDIMQGILDLCKIRSNEANEELNDSLNALISSRSADSDSLSLNTLRYTLSRSKMECPHSSVIVGARKTGYVNDLVTAINSHDMFNNELRMN